jgi:hypothetical protein
MSDHVAVFAVRNIRYVWCRTVDATREGNAFVTQYAFLQGDGEEVGILLLSVRTSVEYINSNSENYRHETIYKPTSLGGNLLPFCFIFLTLTSPTLKLDCENIQN